MASGFLAGGVAAVGNRDEIHAPQCRVVSSRIRSLLLAGFLRAA